MQILILLSPLLTFIALGALSCMCSCDGADPMDW